MLNVPPQRAQDDPDRVDRIVAEGPHGALVLASIATALVVAMWFAFYLLVFLPRGPLE